MLSMFLLIMSIKIISNIQNLYISGCPGSTLGTAQQPWFESGPGPLAASRGLATNSGHAKSVFVGSQPSCLDPHFCCATFEIFISMPVGFLYFSFLMFFLFWKPSFLFLGKDRTVHIGAPAALTHSAFHLYWKVTISEFPVTIFNWNDVCSIGSS